jgi:hypothetical protein
MRLMLLMLLIIERVRAVSTNAALILKYQEDQAHRRSDLLWRAWLQSKESVMVVVAERESVARRS